MRTPVLRSVLGGGTGWPHNCLFRVIWPENGNPSTFDETDGSEWFQWAVEADFDRLIHWQGAVQLPTMVKAGRIIRVAWQGDAGDLTAYFACDKDWANWMKTKYNWTDMGSSGDYDVWNPEASLGEGWFIVKINGVDYRCWASDSAVRCNINSVGSDAYFVCTLYGFVDATGECFAQMSLANPGAWLTKGMEIQWGCNFP